MSRRKTVTRTNLIKKVSKYTGVSSDHVALVYDALFYTMTNDLREGKEISFPGIGRINFIATKETRSNMTGQRIPPHKRLKFKPNVALARFIRVNTREFKI